MGGLRTPPSCCELKRFGYTEQATQKLKQFGNCWLWHLRIWHTVHNVSSSTIKINNFKLPGSPAFVVHCLQTSAPAHRHDCQQSQQGEKTVSATIHSRQHRKRRVKQSQVFHIFCSVFCGCRHLQYFMLVKELPQQDSINYNSKATMNKELKFQ